MSSGVAWSAGADASQLQTRLEKLLFPSGKWILTADGRGMERVIKFKTFKAAWTFMNDVAAQCKTARHHPEWANTYNTVFVRWTTHNPQGLSEKDINMATLCDELATRDESREVETEEHEGDNASVRARMAGNVEQIKDATGDCCGPSKT